MSGFLSPVSGAYRISQSELDYAMKELGEFVAIPSVSDRGSPDYKKAHLDEAADYAAKKLTDIGFEVRSLVSIEGSAQSILAKKVVDASLPTIHFYCHYDVQPVDRTKWKSDPFVMVERDGRLYGRGASDDKAGIIAVITALGAYEKAYGKLPVNVNITFEGEEENDSDPMEALIEQEPAHFQADAFVVLDGVNANAEIGTLNNATRGLLNFRLEIRSMAQSTHSGLGCLVPDPSQALAALMHAVRDPRKIPGFMDDCEPLTPQEVELLRRGSRSEASYAADHKLIPQAKLRGDSNISVDERVMMEPSISFVNGRWGQPNGGNSIQEVASAMGGVRLTAGQDPERVFKVLREYLLNLPEAEDYEVTITQDGAGCFAWKGDISQPYFQKYLESLGENFEETTLLPVGGTIPFLHTLQKKYPKMDIIMGGVEDPLCAAHSDNESQHIGLFRRAINSCISFLHKIHFSIRGS